jgi:hypothetical protein
MTFLDFSEPIRKLRKIRCWISKIAGLVGSRLKGSGLCLLGPITRGARGKGSAGSIGIRAWRTAHDRLR